MRHPAVLVAAYALIAALAAPGSILAQDEATPAGTETAPAEPAGTETAPAEPAAPTAAPADPAAPAAAPAEPAPAQPEPAPAAPAEPAAAQPEATVLADEGAGSRTREAKAFAAASGSVTIADFSFAPGTITIDQGDTVTWTNSGPSAHSATSTNGAFDTGILEDGGSGSHTFDQAGTYSYVCTPHPFMHGTVVVRAAQAGGGDTSGSAGGTSGTAGDSGDEAAGSDGGPTLPNSGIDSGALLVLGALFLLLGIAGHWVTSRAHEQEDPRGRGQARP
jgi:plastocyanin